MFNEREFSVILEEQGYDHLWNGSIDRMVLFRGPDGAPTRAEIIDHKTDRVTPQTLEGVVAYYAPQVEGYGRVVSRMSDLPLERISTKLAFLGAGIAHELSSD